MVGYGRVGSRAHERLRGMPEDDEKNHYALGRAGALEECGERPLDGGHDGRSDAGRAKRSKRCPVLASNSGTAVQFQCRAHLGVGQRRVVQAVGSAVERSYSRSTFPDKRRALLDAWSALLAGDVAVIAEGGLSLRPTAPR